MKSGNSEKCAGVQDVTLKLIIRFSISAFLFFFLYHVASQWLFALWNHDKPYSHGFFVPLVALYLLWIRREYLRTHPVRPCWWIGGAAILSCCVLLLLGRVGAIVQLEVMSLYFIVPASILFLWGWHVLRALWFPLFYLQFMIPWTDEFLHYAYPFFREISAILGTWFLTFRYPAFRDGTLIHLPDITLSVVDACSGISFLLSVAALGVLLGYMTQKSWFRVFVVVMLGVLMTVLANGIRIGLAGIMGQEYGADMLHGPGHILRGWFVAQVGWVGVFFVNWLITKIPDHSKYYLCNKWKEKISSREASTGEQTARERKPPFVVFVLGIVCFGMYLNFFSLPQAIDLSTNLNTMPMQMESWKGRDLSWFTSGDYYPGVDQEVLRSYRTPTGRSVVLYIGYFSKQLNEARLVSYLSRPLFKGKKEVRINVSDNTPLIANYSRPQVESTHYKLLSWYQFPDAQLAASRDVKLEGIRSALISHRNNGAVVLVAKQVDGEDSDESVSEDVSMFAQLVAPMVKELLHNSR